MTFGEFSYKNNRRCTLGFGFIVNEWSLTDWMCALTGEIGEAANLIKKLRRGEKIDKKEICFELADAITYIDLLMLALNLDTESILKEKFNIVSDRLGSDIKL